jgi:predicted nucleic acid-binding protein
MARKFLDTSAIIKLYRDEPDSPVVRAHVAPSDELLISRLTVLEFRSALLGLVWQGKMSEHGARARIAAFDADLGSYTVVPITDSILNRAASMIEAFTPSSWLKPPDAIQIATALEAHDEATLDAVVTTDAKQRVVAEASGFVVLP